MISNSSIFPSPPPGPCTHKHLFRCIQGPSKCVHRSPRSLWGKGPPRCSAHEGGCSGKSPILRKKLGTGEPKWYRQIHLKNGQHFSNDIWREKWRTAIGKLASVFAIAVAGLAAGPALARGARIEDQIGTFTVCRDGGDVEKTDLQWQDTGIRLADTEEESGESEAPDSSTKTKGKKQRIAERRAREKRIVKKGRPYDFSKSIVPDPDLIPSNDSPEAKELMSNWRMDKLKNVTYTQFWALVREGHVQRVKFTKDHRSIIGNLRSSAPGGARQIKVGLPYDPDLLEHLIANNVYVEDSKIDPLANIILTVFRLIGPAFVAYILVQASYRIGQKKDKGDKIFGGADLDMMEAKNLGVSFKDIAGISEIKEEIKEIVAFLKNPTKFMEMGARSPGGILLVGPPGTGKTLLAKAIAGEAQVRFFSTAGTEFMEMYVGVGASRVRDMFQKARAMQPCILFIDEFDGVGKQRTYGAGGDESVHTINQLLTEMDGFEDNTGVVVIAATNRPGTLDQALTRPGRFDRIIQLPLPNLQGRIEVLEVHSRGKLISDEIDFSKVSRATAGFTGAELMNLMNQSAIVAVRQAHVEVNEMDVFTALESIQLERQNRLGSQQYDEDIIAPMLRRAISVYEAGRAIVGFMTPDYDEVHKISVCTNGVPTGNTFFIPQEERLESRVITRSFLESKLVVCMAGRCAERLLLGDNYVSSAGTPDLEQANVIAREMIYRCGFSKRIGPVALMDTQEYAMADKHKAQPVASLSTELARVAFKESRELIDAAEAKALYGLAINYETLEAVVDVLYHKETMSGKDLRKIFAANEAGKFPDPFLEGFGWSEDGDLLFRDRAAKKESKRTHEKYPVQTGGFEGDESVALKEFPWWDPANPYKTRWDLPDLIGKQFREVA